MEGGRAGTESLAAAHEALDRHDWHSAFELLSAADAGDALGPDDLEALATAAFWTGRRTAAVDSRERAYASYLAAGRGRHAARVAIALSDDYRERMLSAATSSGWLSRAERLLDSEPECRERGEILIRDAHALGDAGDLEAAIEAAGEARQLGRRVGSRDLEVRGVQLEGSALVRAGRVDEGFGLLDEAASAAVRGELDPSATFSVYRAMIDACRELVDYARASDWTAAAERWCDREAIAGLTGVWRVRRAEALAFRGAWPEAEQEARRAWDELREFESAAAGAALYEVGQIRLRLGDLDGADESFRHASELGHTALPGLAELRLQQGRAEGAARRLGRALAESRSRLERARLLPAQAVVALATGDLAAADAAARELEDIAAGYGSAGLQAPAAQARGAVELRRGEGDAALTALRHARRLWRELEAPYDEARTRALLGEAHRLAGDDDSAELEVRAAKALFERLGAGPDARRARELLGPDGATAGRLVQRTFMFTDIVGSTALVDAIGDEAWDDVLSWHDEALRALFGEHGGEEVDHDGEGFFVAFPDERSAVTCALAVQRRLADHRRTHGFAPQVRIGLHATAAADGGHGYRGKGVHEAARIATLAEGGEILASRETAAAAPDAPLADPRRVTLKGISTPLDVVTLDWR